ncbi:sensor domain-containing protein [Ornithinimicrobium sp. F0845]|uniref:sensor domain-containing protein n=1 Tax=Ornithinimicrobium sp. F0845 TaxID=2926412 RepID=UPI001FF1F345|nr:sensor domain-containing protein [Ornithinimicrobium sp. F0845]MCK0112963.1 sensor domain-containing protein [Ornithinimicrobium sp. F0845]
MTTQTLSRTPGPPAVAPPLRRVPLLSWRSAANDLAYLTAGFFLTLFSFILLTTLFVIGLSTLVLWIGAPILGFMLLTATGFARENRELLRRWGRPVAEPVYRGRRPLSMLADPKAWLETLHGTLVAFPLRITTFSVAITWLAGALGGLTWFLWGHFIPQSEYDGLTWLLVHVAGIDLSSSRYLVESVLMFAAGLLLLVTAPLVTRLCATIDAGVARALLGGFGSAPEVQR